MTYKEARIKFTDMVSLLIQWSWHYRGENGEKYEMSVDWTRRCMECPVGIENSAHKIVLAVDINLYKDGVYQRSTKAHKPFGNYWKTLHPLARWGGDFTEKDGNHYSLEFWGRK